MRNNIPAIVSALLVLLFGTGPAFASSDSVVIELGELAVTHGELNDRFQLAVRILAANQGISLADQDPAVIERLRVQYLNKHASELVMLAEAARREISASPDEVNAGVDALRASGINGDSLLRQIVQDEVTIQLLTEQILEEIAIPPGDVVTLHHDIKHSLITPEEVCLRHIQTETAEAAAEILAALDEGTEFEVLVTTRSTDKESASKDGDLGCFQKGPAEAAKTEFEKAAFALRKTGVGGPIESEFGYHVINVYKYKSAHELTLNEAYADIEKELKHEQLPNRVNALVSKSGITVYPENFTTSDGGG